MIYPLLGIIAVALAVAGSVWLFRRTRIRTVQAPGAVPIHDRVSHRLDRIRRAGL